MAMNQQVKHLDNGDFEVVYSEPSEVVEERVIPIVPLSQTQLVG